MSATWLIRAECRLGRPKRHGPWHWQLPWPSNQLPQEPLTTFAGPLSFSNACETPSYSSLSPRPSLGYSSLFMDIHQLPTLHFTNFACMSLLVCFSSASLRLRNLTKTLICYPLSADTTMTTRRETSLHCRLRPL